MIHNKATLAVVGRQKAALPKSAAAIPGILGWVCYALAGGKERLSQGKEHLPPSAGVSEVLRSSSLEG